MKKNELAEKRFTAKDAERYKKGLTDKQKEKWMEAANASLNACLVSGGSDLECEMAAIKHANSLFSKNRKAAETRYLTENNVIEVDGKKIETRLRLALQEADNTDEYQMVLPIGAFHSSWYGEIIITPAFCDAMHGSWQKKVLGNRQPFIDTLHDRGKANGWILDLDVRADGLYAKIDWTKMGEENIREKYFKYFSSDIGEVTDIETGEKVWPVLIAVALCNTPVMNGMPEARLSEPSERDVKNNPAHSDGGSSNRQEAFMASKEELLEALKQMEPDDRASFLKELGFSQEQTVPASTNETDENSKALEKEMETLALAVDRLTQVVSQFSGSQVSGQGSGPEEKPTDSPKQGEKPKDPAGNQGKSEETVKLEAKMEALQKANEQLTGYVDNLQAREKEKRKSDVLTAALQANRITPKDREFWEKRFDKDPDGVTEILNRLPSRENLFQEEGTGDGGSEMAPLNKEDKFMMSKLGLSEEDMEKYGGKVAFPVNDQ